MKIIHFSPEPQETERVTSGNQFNFDYKYSFSFLVTPLTAPLANPDSLAIFKLPVSWQRLGGARRREQNETQLSAVSSLSASTASRGAPVGVRGRGCCWAAFQPRRAVVSLGGGWT